MIGFWKTKDKYGFLSNWWICVINYDGRIFCSSEQVFMYMKAKLFKDEEIAEQILGTTDQKKIKDLGRAVKNFDQLVWDNYKYSLMMEANALKYKQNPMLQKWLVATGDEQLCEASPYDTIWGIGLSVDTPDYLDPLKWKGQNLLGCILMNLRNNYIDIV